jgi:Leucine-rich repeat (LRR) protein
MPRLATVLLTLLASTAQCLSQTTDTLKPDSLSQSVERQHSNRWRELSRFVPLRPSEASKTATFLTLTDDHIAKDGGISSDVLDSLIRRKHLVGISLRNTRITNSALSSLLSLKNQLQVLDLYGTRIDDNSLKTVGALTELRELDLGVTRVTSPGLTALTSLKKLRVLELSGRRINDSATIAIGQLPSLVQLSLPGTRVTDKGLSALTTLSHLKALGLAGTRIEGGTLDKLAVLPDLVCLDLADTDITGDSVGKLSAFRMLKALNLENCPLVVDASTTHLARLTSLQGLVLRKTGFEKESITATGLARLASLSQLQHLNLSATRVNDAAIASLTNLKKLRSLDLGLTGLGNAGLVHLAKLPRLESLGVMYQEGFGGTKVTAEGLQHLAEHKTLSKLDLTGTKISDADLPKFRSVANLKQLTISGTAITAAGANKLRKQLPGCRIIR